MKKKFLKLIIPHFITKLLLTLLPILGLTPLSSIIVYLFARYLTHYFMD